MCRQVQQKMLKDMKLAEEAKKTRADADPYAGRLADWRRDMLDPNSGASINNKPSNGIDRFNRFTGRTVDNDSDIVSQQVVAQPSLAEDSVEPTNKARKKVRGFNDLISSIKFGTLLGGLIGGKDTLG